MPGLRWAPFWEGDRAEVFAQYVLSNIAAVVPVPRPVDFGFDCLCTLVSQKGDALYAGRSFGVQIKSAGSSKIVYGGFDQKGRWKGYEIEWLYGQSQPLLICLSDIKKQEVKLYNVSRMWCIRWTNPRPSQILLVPDEYPSKNIREDPCPREPLKNIPSGKFHGDGYSYRVPLGAPIVSIFLKEEDTHEQRERIRVCLDGWLALEYQNIWHYQMRIPYSLDVLKYQTNQPPNFTGSVRSFRYHISREPEAHVRSILLSIAPAIESLIRNLAAHKQADKLVEVLPIAHLARAYGAFFWSETSKFIDEYQKRKEAQESPDIK